jgi:hypothetical protein
MMPAEITNADGDHRHAIHQQAGTVTFDVGGQLHRVSRSLIMDHESSMLASLVSERWNAQSRAEGDDAQVESGPSIFIDRNGERFAYVLVDFMRYGRVVLPYSISKELLLLDLDFYGIEGASRDTVLYGHAPHGQPIVKELWGERTRLRIAIGALQSNLDKVETEMAIVQFASICFACYADQRGKSTFVSFAHLGDSDKQILDELIEKDFGDHCEDEESFLVACLELYGLAVKGIETCGMNSALVDLESIQERSV